MAHVIITIKLMMENPEVDINKVKEDATKIIEDFGGEVGKVEEEPLAFGLVSLLLTFVMDEKKGGTDPLEDSLSEVNGVGNVEMVDVRRAIG